MKKILAIILSTVILSNFAVGSAFAQNSATKSNKQQFIENVPKTENDTQNSKKLKRQRESKKFLFNVLSGYVGILLGALLGSKYGEGVGCLNGKSCNYIKAYERGVSMGKSDMKIDVKNEFLKLKNCLNKTFEPIDLALSCYEANSYDDLCRGVEDKLTENMDLIVPHDLAKNINGRLKNFVNFLEKEVE